MSRRITFVGPVNAFTGYGLHSIAIIQGLVKRCIHVAVRATGVDQSQARVPNDVLELLVNGVQPEPWELLLNPPVLLPTPGKKTAYFTMWESSIMQAPGVQYLNMAECVITPSQWNASCFSAQGVTKPIHIVPLGIYQDIFVHRAPNRHPAHIDPPFVFGTAARARHGGVRKGLQDVIDVFQRAFPDGENVKLKVKCFGDDPDVNLNGDGRIELVKRCMSQEEIADWFKGIDCFVSMSCGEGWGLMQQQAMATGRPVIAARFGGLAEFMTERNSYCVPFDIVPASGGYQGMGVWSKPREADVVKTMRLAVQNRWEVEARGCIAAEDAGKFTWDRSIDELVAVLERIGAV